MKAGNDVCPNLLPAKPRYFFFFLVVFFFAFGLPHLLQPIRSSPPFRRAAFSGAFGFHDPCRRCQRSLRTALCHLDKPVSRRHDDNPLCSYSYVPHTHRMEAPYHSRACSVF